MSRRKSHSRPLRCIQWGAWGLRPMWKSKAAPTLMRTGAVGVNGRKGGAFVRQILSDCFHKAAMSPFVHRHNSYGNKSVEESRMALHGPCSLCQSLITRMAS